MAAVTGIELGPDSCVLVAVRAGAGGTLDVSALSAIERANWPATDVAQADTLRDARRRQKFPKAARVVAWGLPEELPADSAIARASLRCITAAGFRIESVITPPQALALLAGSRPRSAGTEAVAWLSLNIHGAAIAIVRGSELLFSRTFGWSYEPGEMSSRRQLLQRYSLVAHLGPELRRGIAAVRAHQGLSVDAVVTCGDLPELRSLTMPLIEELDLEVETLDSIEGLRPVGRARHERFADAAPAIRLACAAATAPASGQRRTPVSLPAVAAAAVVAALAWAGYAYFTRPVVQPVAPAQTVARPAAPNPAAGRNAAGPNAVARNAAPPAPSSQVQTTSKPVTTPTVPQPQSAPKSAAAPPPAAAAARPPQQTASVPPRPSAPAEPKVTTPAAPSTTSAAPSTTSAAPSKPGDRPLIAAPPPALQIARPGAATRAPVAARQTPLKDPLPRIDSILIDQNRRLAIIEGGIVAVGDAVGPRVVAQIEPNAVILREPSGLLVRVLMRQRPEYLSFRTPR